MITFREKEMTRQGTLKKGSTVWEPPEEIPREAVVEADKTVSGMADVQVKAREDIFRLRALEMDWDIGVMLYEPEDDAKIPRGPDGKKIGIFLLHGGTGDYKSVEPVARMLSSKFGFKVASMTFPGRLYMLDPSRDWPGDVLNPDGTARTPMWTKDLRINPDQYQVAQDSSIRKKYGTIISLVAKEGTEFYYRMAAWPVAFDEAIQETCRRYLPPDHYSVYGHGHSTGGPFVMIASQQVPNFMGILGYGSVPFGYIFAKITGKKWDFPFNSLRLRTWRDTARYAHEEFSQKAISLPLMMELVFERWEREQKRANFKAEDFVHKNNTVSLAEAARATARRLKMGSQESEALVARYVGYCREQSGPGVKPVPPVLSVHGLADDTVTFTDYLKAIPLFSTMTPPPKVRVVRLGTGVHRWLSVEDDLPNGIIPAVLKLWNEAIMNGFFLT
jgi:hypothetical protein